MIAILDSTNTLTSAYTSTPTKGTMWSLLFRAVFGHSLKARLRGIWVRAQHATPRSGVFALLNTTSHLLAMHGLRMAWMRTVPLLQLLTTY